MDRIWIAGAELEARTARGPAADFHGGSFCELEFDGDPGRIG